MKRPRARYALAQGVVRFYLGTLLGCRVEGRQHVPPEGACLLAANHKSYLDPPAVGAYLGREIHYFAKKQLFAVPILGPAIRDWGAIPVDRGGFDRRAIAAALAILRRGEALLLFPEGTRIRKPELGTAKEGVALLALQSGVPVIPVYVGHTWEPRRRLFRRIPVVIRYGPALCFEPPSEGDRRERYRAVADQVMRAISDLSGGEARVTGRGLVSAPPPA